MNLLVVGGGGREHAIIKKLKENPTVETIYALPGNGGIAQDAVCVPEIGAKDIEKIVDFAKSHAIGFAVVAPDDPLALGCVDRLHDAGIPCFGPGARAARIEASKVFAKNLMKQYGIPTARYEVFDDPARALAYLRETASFPIVIKADGLALGKGVLIPQNLSEAEAAVKSIMEDKAIAPMVSSMDHKRAGDGDTGLNTGGMGTIAPNPCYTPEIAAECMERIFLPTLAAMRAEGCPFKGCLYFGLMITSEGPKVIEYNCRFGDPETQVVLPLLKTDLLTVMRAVENETLGDLAVEWRGGFAACVILASGGYPGGYEKGKAIVIPEDLPENVTVYHAGDKLENGKLVTSGGRVLGVTAAGETLQAALDSAYASAERIRFDGKYLRHDIGQRALRALEG